MMMTLKMMTLMMMTCMLLLLATVQCSPLKSTACGENDVKCIEDKIRLDNFKMFFLKELGLDAPPTYNGSVSRPSQQEIDSLIAAYNLEKEHVDYYVFNCGKSVTEEDDDCSFELANEKRDFPADEALLEVSIREDFTRTVPFTTNLNINGNRVLVTVDKQSSHSQKIDITQIFNSWLNEEVYEKLRVSVEDESVLAVDVLDDSSEHAPLLHVKWSTRKQRITRSIHNDDDGPCSGPNPSGCCPRDFRVNFKDIGWGSWVVFPEFFNAGYCSGDCHYAQLETQREQMIGQTFMRNNIPIANKVSCVPASFRNISYVFFSNGELHDRTLYGMRLTSCKCIV